MCAAGLPSGRRGPMGFSSVPDEFKKVRASDRALRTLWSVLTSWLVCRASERVLAWFGCFWLSDGVLLLRTFHVCSHIEDTAVTVMANVPPGLPKSRHATHI